MKGADKKQVEEGGGGGAPGMTMSPQQIAPGYAEEDCRMVQAQTSQKQENICSICETASQIGRKDMGYGTNAEQALNGHYDLKQYK